MKIRSFLVGTCALILAGCQSYKGLVTPEDHRNPQVTVVDDRRIVVKPAILGYLPNERDFFIVWQLPKDSKYRFTTKDGVGKEDGIVIEGELTDQVLRGKDKGQTLDSVALGRQDEIVRCVVRPGGLEFACFNKHTKPGIYKYTIRVTDGRTTLQRDPPIVNW